LPFGQCTFTATAEKHPLTMKHFLLFSIVTLFIFSCQKDLQPGDSDYLQKAKKALKDSLSIADFAALDFSKAARLRVDSIDFYALRVPFKGKVPQEEFVFIKTDTSGQIQKGKIVQLQGRISEDGSDNLKRKRWDGTITLTSLDKKSVFASPIVNGFITAFHQQNSYRTMSQEPQGDVMPEVIITYVKSDAGFS
jgi:hypothetical protein